jgi:hypothetical protein
MGFLDQGEKIGAVPEHIQAPRVFAECQIDETPVAAPLQFGAILL